MIKEALMRWRIPKIPVSEGKHAEVIKPLLDRLL